MVGEILIIVNPAAGGGKARRAEPKIAELLSTKGASAKFVHSKNSEDIREQAARAAADGAFHHVIEGARGTGVQVGFFPAGNGNDIARSLEIPSHAVRAAEAFLGGAPRPIDLVRVHFSEDCAGHYIGVGGLGLDAEAAHLANSRYRKWPGLSRYLAGALSIYWRGAPYELNATLDNERWSGRALFAAVANGTRYGAGIRIAPEAKMDDGWLDVALVGEMPLVRFLRAIPIVLTSGDLRGFPEVRRYRCRCARFETNRIAKVHGDGEWMGESPAEFQVVPAGIQVRVPKRGFSGSE